MNPDLPSILTGSVSTAGVLGLWIKSIIAEKAELINDRKEGLIRERQLSADTLEALILSKNVLENFLSTHQGQLSDLGDSIQSEISKLTLQIATLNHALQTDTE